VPHKEKYIIQKTNEKDLVNSAPCGAIKRTVMSGRNAVHGRVAPSPSFPLRQAAVHEDDLRHQIVRIVFDTFLPAVFFQIGAFGYGRTQVQRAEHESASKTAVVMICPKARAGRNIAAGQSFSHAHALHPAFAPLALFMGLGAKGRKADGAAIVLGMTTGVVWPAAGADAVLLRVFIEVFQILHVFHPCHARFRVWLLSN
jgi:hypothetical protein